MHLPAEDLRRLQATSFGQSLPLAQLEQLLAAGELVRWSKGTAPLLQGHKPTQLFILLRGRVALTMHRRSGEETVLEIVSSGDIVPLAPVLQQLSSPVGLQALTLVEACALRASEFLQLCQSLPALASACNLVMARQWRAVAEQNKALKLQSTQERLGHFLLSHTDGDDGTVEVQLQDERRLLARRLGMTPESLSRAIAHLAGCGVEFQQQRVIIRDVDRLRTFCGFEVAA